MTNNAVCPTLWFWVRVRVKFWFGWASELVSGEWSWLWLKWLKRGQGTPIAIVHFFLRAVLASLDFSMDAHKMQHQAKRRRRVETTYFLISVSRKRATMIPAWFNLCCIGFVHPWPPFFMLNWPWYVFCVQDGRDGAVAAAESECPGADCRGHGGHHEGLQGRLTSNEGLTLPVVIQQPCFHQVIRKIWGEVHRGESEIKLGLPRLW